MQEIVRRLIDEPRQAARPKYPRVVEIALRECVEPGSVELVERLDVCKWIQPVPDAAELTCDGGDIRQLARAFDLRVTGEYLLLQRRSGARQPDNKYRVGSLQAPAGAGGKEFECEDLFAALHVCDQTGGVIRHGLLSQ